jgi:rSAM/selenodomain-associated transferase 2
LNECTGRVERSGQLRLSVIVPVLDEAAHIGMTLRDLDGCRIPGTEVLVVDGGSSDATREIAEPFCDQVIDAPRGRACQMSAGAALAQGEIFWFLHADTRVPLDAAAAIDTTVASGREWGRFDVRLSGSGALLRMVERTMNLRSCLSGIVTGDQGLFVTRALFRAVGGFPDIPLMEDIALSQRLRGHQRPACVGTKLITSSRRWERNGVWRTVLLMWRLRTAYALGADPARLLHLYRESDPSH